MSRRGRKRKPGRRKPSGRLADIRYPSPAEIAASQPHRRALGEKASSQLAESMLGRLVLRRAIDPDLGIAGERYHADWRGYIAAINAPRSLAVTAGGVSRCQSCHGTIEEDLCLCMLRKKRWREVREALADTGASHLVDAVALNDAEISPQSVWLLRVGLSALAHHYGLVVNVRNRASERMTAKARGT